MLVLAIHDYTQGLPPQMATSMYMQAPNFIDALVADPVVAEQVKKSLKDSLG